MTAHRLAYDLGKIPHGRDPGDAGTFDLLDRSLMYYPMVSAAAETRTLARASSAGKIVTIALDTDGGNVTLTVTGGFEPGGDTTIIFNDAGDYVTFISIDNGTTVDWRIMASSGVGMVNNLVSLRSRWEFLEDFNMAALDETNEQWVLNSGSDAAAVDPAIVVAEGGTVFLDCGIGDGTIAADGSQIVLAIPVQADSGGLVFEGRLHIEDITGCSVNFGLTDVTTLEEPFSGATDTITSVASNAVAFLFDDGNTTKEWFMCGVDGDTDATGIAATGTAPVNSTYQILRCEIDADGEGAQFFIDGTSVGSLTASVCSATTNLYLTAVICGDGGNSAAVGLTVDYMYVSTLR